MKKNDIFTFTASNGVEVTAICLGQICEETIIDASLHTHIGYAQNRLFIFTTSKWYDGNVGKVMEGDIKYDRILVDYAVLPDYDALLERYNDIEVAQAENINGM